MLIKICGIQTIEAALIAEREKADFIGFVFAPSSRRISPNEARKIAKRLNSSIKIVGVFVNESADNIKHIADYVGLDYVQLHGDETAKFAKSLGLRVIKAFTFHEKIENDIKQFPADYYIIDSPGEKYRGGSGKTFNWDDFDNTSTYLKKTFLAGGLNETNISQAIKKTNPIGVDVSSGVETHGEKDSKKIINFIKNARKDV